MDEKSINPSFIFPHVVMEASSACSMANAVTQSRNKNVSADPEIYWISEEIIGELVPEGAVGSLFKGDSTPHWIHSRITFLGQGG
jgi:hypothetical protein